ncbi:ead/Ea22-like family protein, partial [Escherichia coli]
MQRLEMTARFFIQRLEQSGISEQRRQPVSEIDYQALREAAERAIPAMERLLMLPVDDDLLSEQELKDYGVDIDALNAFKFLAGPETVLALLDEINALEETRINDVCRIAELTKQLESAKSKL